MMRVKINNFNSISIVTCQNPIAWVLYCFISYLCFVFWYQYILNIIYVKFLTFLEKWSFSFFYYDNIWPFFSHEGSFVFYLCCCLCFQPELLRKEIKKTLFPCPFAKLKTKLMNWQVYNSSQLKPVKLHPLLRQ